MTQQDNSQVAFNGNLVAIAAWLPTDTELAPGAKSFHSCLFLRASSRTFILQVLIPVLPP